jgi:hypothetical protein
MDAFTTHADIVNYADKYYENFNTYKDIFKSAVYVAATCFADAFIVSFWMFEKRFLSNIRFRCTAAS